MASRIPLVIVGGQIQQLQAGDTINVASAEWDNRVWTNGESSFSLVAGTPVYISGANTVKRAEANAASTASVSGLLVDPSVSVGNTGNFAAGGIITCTTVQWDAVVTGESGGLTPNSLYFLDPANPGKLTTTAPSTVGQLVTVVGRASSTVDMELVLAQPIQL
jgi:hypothetical protein